MVTNRLRPKLWVSVRQRVNASHRQRSILMGGWHDGHLVRVSFQCLYRNMSRDKGLLSVGKSLAGLVHNYIRADVQTLFNERLDDKWFEILKFSWFHINFNNPSINNFFGINTLDS